MRIADRNPQALADRPPTSRTPGAEDIGAPISTLMPPSGRTSTRRGPPRVAMVNSSPSARPVFEQIPCEHADAVAAHLGDAAVSVPVIHEPEGVSRLIRCGQNTCSGPPHRRHLLRSARRNGSPARFGPRTGRVGPHRGGRTTRSTPSPPSPALRSHSRATSAGKDREPIGVRQDHEVVLGTVSLREPHTPILVGRASDRGRPRRVIGPRLRPCCRPAGVWCMDRANPPASSGARVVRRRSRDCVTGRRSAAYPLNHELGPSASAAASRPGSRRVEPADAGIAPEPRLLPAREAPRRAHRLLPRPLLRALTGEEPEHLGIAKGTARRRGLRAARRPQADVPRPRNPRATSPPPAPRCARQAAPAARARPICTAG